MAIIKQMTALSGREKGYIIEHDYGVFLEIRYIDGGKLSASNWYPSIKSAKIAFSRHVIETGIKWEYVG